MTGARIRDRAKLIAAAVVMTALLLGIGTGFDALIYWLINR